MQRGFDCQEAELAMARARHTEKAQTGNRKAIEALEEVKRQQRQLVNLRESAMTLLRREPELIMPGAVTFVAHALVVPSNDPADRELYDVNVERVAMKIAQAFEEAPGPRFWMFTRRIAPARRTPRQSRFRSLIPTARKRETGHRGQRPGRNRQY